ncbi:MAG: cadmium-translocating P-type ATPase [Planctomycetales bacterium]|nr:cadmium-translocating P-type ATPase [Planctomycetales bacterium]
MSQPSSPESSTPKADFKQLTIAALALLAIAVYLLLRFAWDWPEWPADVPLLVALILGGVPLVWELLQKLLRQQFGSDLLAGISIVTSVILGEYLAGTLVVLMLSGGEALEAYAVRSASSVLQALSKRMPRVAHRKAGTRLEDIPLDALQIDDLLMVLPHEVCPVDGVVVDGRGVMDESYLTGEPYRMSKMPGAGVLSGAINGDSALTICATRRAVDSRYAQIMRVMHSSQQQRPRIRRLGDQLGAVYTPIAVALGIIAWLASGDPLRFLAVMVVATPCPLLIAIPVAIIGSISLSARRAIIVRDPAVLEQIDHCRTMIFDKTGTLTYGQPRLIEQMGTRHVDAEQVLSYVASLEQYSKHPLSRAILDAAQEQHVALLEVSEVRELPGAGLTGRVAGRSIQVTSRDKLASFDPAAADQLPLQAGGLECVILIDGHYAATYRFRDTPRRDGASFVRHLPAKHGIKRIVLLSGDRKSEVAYLADLVGISEYYGNQSPEDKLSFVRAANAQGATAFVGDGINDAPALMAASVGIAFGQNSDVTTEAAGVVIMDSSLLKVNDLLHIGRRMRRIALQSAVGGMALSIVGMTFAALGYLPPVAGALAQEVIDVVAVLNALRAALPTRELDDF